MCLFVCFITLFLRIRFMTFKCVLCDFIDSVTGSKRADGCNSAPEKLARCVIIYWVQIACHATPKAHKYPTPRALSNADRKNQPDQQTNDRCWSLAIVMVKRTWCTWRSVRIKQKGDEKEKKKGKRNNMLENSWLTLMNWKDWFFFCIYFIWFSPRGYSLDDNLLTVIIIRQI